MKQVLSYRTALDTQCMFYCNKAALIMAMLVQAFCRRFSWHDVMLWPQELPSNSLVVLSGKDNLVPWQLARRQLALTHHPASIMIHPHLGHGGFILADAWQMQILGALQSML